MAYYGSWLGSRSRLATNACLSIRGETHCMLPLSAFSYLLSAQLSRDESYPVLDIPSALELRAECCPVGDVFR